MNKLELYKEILEIDPNSRVFFLYAKLLVEDKQIEKALAILANGLEKQPEYLEARLYYIDLLAKNNKFEIASVQLNKFTDIFRQYSGFWLMWSKLSAEDNPSISSTLALLSAFFNNPSLSFMQVLQAGIQSVLPNEFSQSLQANPSYSHSDRPEQKDFSSFSYESYDQPIQYEHGKNQDILHTEDLHYNSAEERAKYFNSFDSYTEHSQEYAQDMYPKSSTLTKSMADLLAEQGDFEGAKNIYIELINCTEENTVEIAVLKQRLEALKEIITKNNNFSQRKENRANYTLQEQEKKYAQDFEHEKSAQSISLFTHEGQEHNPIFSANYTPSVQEQEKKVSPRMQSMLNKLADRLERRATP